MRQIIVMLSEAKHLYASKWGDSSLRKAFAQNDES